MCIRDSEYAVEFYLWDTGVIGAEQKQIVLHFLHAAPGGTHAQRRAGISARALTGPEEAVGDIGVHFIQLVPGSTADDAVHRQAVELLELSLIHI